MKYPFIKTDKYNYETDEFNKFVGLTTKSSRNVMPTNIIIYIHRFHVTDEYTGRMVLPHVAAICPIYFSVNRGT
jgi:hypothetical protein